MVSLTNLKAILPLHRLIHPGLTLLAVLVCEVGCKSRPVELKPLNPAGNHNHTGTFNGDHRIDAQGVHVRSGYLGGSHDYELSEATKNARLALQKTCIPDPPHRIEPYAYYAHGKFFEVELRQMVQSAQPLASGCAGIEEKPRTNWGKLTCTVTMSMEMPDLRERCRAAYRRWLAGDKN